MLKMIKRQRFVGKLPLVIILLLIKKLKENSMKMIEKEYTNSIFENIKV